MSAPIFLYLRSSSGNLKHQLSEQVAALRCPPRCCVGASGCRTRHRVLRSGWSGIDCRLLASYPVHCCDYRRQGGRPRLLRTRCPVVRTFGTLAPHAERGHEAGARTRCSLEAPDFFDAGALTRWYPTAARRAGAHRSNRACSALHHNQDDDTV